MPDHGGLDLAWPPIVENVEDAEEKSVGSLNQQQHDIILSNLANLSLGGEAAAKVHVVTRQQQHQNEAKLSNDDTEKCKSSEKKKKVVKVAKDVKEQRKSTSNTVPKGFFRIDKVVSHLEEGGETEYLVRWKGYDQSHDEWKKEQDITSAALDDYRERLKRTIIDDKRKHSTDYGNTPQDPEKQACRYRFASGCKGIRKAHARNAGAPRMEMKRGLAQVQGCEELVKLLYEVGDNRHCTACKLTKSKLPPFPTGKTFRLKRVDPLDKCYIDFSGHMSEESVFHKFHLDPVIVPQSAKCLNSKMVKHCALTKINSVTVGTE
jgi:hypothetical protein